MRTLIATLVILLSQAVIAQSTVSFPTEDGGTIYADLYGKGERGVVLAHGGRFNKGSWEKQARILDAAGFRVLAAVRYLRQTGAQTVSVIGGSMGGSAAGDASIAARPGEIDRLVFLGAAPNGPADKLKSPALFIVARNDTSGDGPRLPGIRAQFEKAPQPKELIILDGSAHAQYLFQTDQGDRVMREILRFLEAK